MKISKLLIIFLCVAPSLVHAVKKNYGPKKVLKVHSVYDGDTFTCTIDGNDPMLCEEIGVRVAGIDTPERRQSTKKSAAERARLKKLANTARWYTACRLMGKRQALKLKGIYEPAGWTEPILKSRRVTLVDRKRPKYFRILANVLFDQRKSLSDELMERGLAKLYDGGTKPTW